MSVRGGRWCAAWVAGLAVWRALWSRSPRRRPPLRTTTNPRAYVTNFNSDTVSVINTRTKIVTKTIGVGDGP